MPKSIPNVASKPTTVTVATTAAPIPAPSSPPTMTSEPGWLTGPTLKAVNEHTFATQRAKKAADRAKAKAPPRKAPRMSATGAASGRSPSSSSSPPSSAAAAFTMSYGNAAAIASVWAEVWDARKSGSAADEDMDWPELPAPLSLSQRLSPSPSGEYALRPTQDREVPLLALARPVKARGGKAKEGEFEFLPPVKDVIALDDSDSNIPDEPWEYVSSVGGDDEARKIFSYAEIVSKST